MKARRYKWGAYCRRNWRCTAVLFRQVVGVGVSETLLRKGVSSSVSGKLLRTSQPRIGSFDTSASIQKDDILSSVVCTGNCEKGRAMLST